MIKGFEHQTMELNDYEREILLPIFVRSLSKRIGKAKAATNKYICERLSELGYTLNDSRLRKIINYIRTNGLVPCLVAANCGYYVAESEQDLLDYEESLLGRENEIRRVRLSIEKQRKSKYHQQELSLFH